MHRCGFAFFLNNHKSVVNALPFLGAALGLASMIYIAESSEYCVGPVSVALLGGAQVLCAVIFLMGLIPQKTLRTNYVLPRWSQYGIYLSGLLATGTVMFVTGINFSVWLDCQNSRLPNRSTATATVATQRFMFGDRTALRSIWVLYEVARGLNNIDSMHFYQDQAEQFCMTVQGLDYKRQILADGTRIHAFNNSAMGNVGSGFVHKDGSIVYFSEDGLVDFATGYFGVQPIYTGVNIKTISVTEKVDGVKEYRFNGATEPQVVYTRTDNATIARAHDGDSVNEFDVHDTSSFTLSNGVSLYFTTSDTTHPQMVAVGLPPGLAAGLHFDQVVTRARVIQHSDGTAQLFLMDSYLRTINEVNIPANPVPAMKDFLSLYEQEKLFDHPKIRPWIDSLFNQILPPGIVLQPDENGDNLEISNNN